MFLSDFLQCYPSVFAVEDDYVLSVTAKFNGLCKIVIGGQDFYEENSGVLCTNKDYFKIPVPQKLLDEAKSYTVVFRKLIERKSYFSALEPEIKESFSFKPLEKTENINIYHIADVHNQVDFAARCASYFGKELDLLIANGDLTEVNELKNYYDLLKMTGAITEGRVPVVFSRGNHDTRGRLAEICNDFYPSKSGKNYYYFTVGTLDGVVLDCGEDKYDFNPAYGGVNIFERYRREETEYLKNLKLKEGKIHFAVSHICPVQATEDKDSKFDIEREEYTKWNKELERMGVKFMLSGHVHQAYYLPPHGSGSLIDHDYPVIIGSEVEKGNLWGTAIVLGSRGMSAVFTDINKKEKCKTYFEF